jgi:5-methylcytosine-specific restriction endonuclease McrA
MRYVHDLDVSKGKAIIMNKNGDRYTEQRYRAAIGSGHFPLNFNFLLIRNEKFTQCSYCGSFVHEKKLTRDHVYPKSKGGIIKTPCCMSCNVEKEDMLPIAWAIHASKQQRDLAVIPIGFTEFGEP